MLTRSTLRSTAGSKLLARSALAALALAVAAPVVATATEPAAVTVLLLRHAETVQGEGRDPRLSETGRARSRALTRLLANAGVTHVFASPYRRTQETVTPTADAVGRAVHVYSVRKPAQLVERLRGLPGSSVAVVAGHSNTIPALVRALGGTIDDLVEHRGTPSLRHDEHDRLFLVTLVAPAGGGPASARSTVELSLPAE